MMLLGRNRPLPVTVTAIVVAIALSLFATRQAVIQSYAAVDPLIVLQLDPYDGTALRRHFDASLSQFDGTSLAEQSSLADRARRSLKRNPLDAGVTRLLAVASGGSRPASVPTLMHLSERISRRDLLDQLWLIEDAVARGDIVKALVHYDRALSVHPAVGDALFPILTGAINQADIREALVPYLRADRPWAITFLIFAAQRAADPTSVADLYLRYDGAHAAPAHRALVPLILGRLAATGRFAAAHQFARRSASDPASIDAPGFSTATFDKRFNPLTWMVDPEADAEIAFVPDAGVEVGLDSGKRVTALRRDLFLAPGRWRFSSPVNHTTMVGQPRLSWTATCRGGEQKRIWTYEVPQSGADRSAAPALVVPAKCAPVQFELVVGSGPVDDARVTVQNVMLSRS